MKKNTYNVAACPHCNQDPKMLEGSGGFAIACGNAACGRAPHIVRPRASQVVRAWNDAAGVPKIRPAVSAPTTMAKMPAVAVASPLELTWRQSLKWRIRRAGLRILWQLSRPGWRACRPCSGKFKLDAMQFVCIDCGLPYCNAEAERMIGGKK